MNYLPRAFYDDVFGQLERNDIEQARKLAGTPGIMTSDHCRKRRELTMWVVLNIKENLCGFELLERPVTSITTVPLSDLHSKYDRITKVNFINSPKGQTEGYQAMPFNEALNKISLALRFASNCELEALADNRYAIVFFKPFFKLLGRSQTFKSVRTPNYGEECEEFVRKQLKSAHLEQLLLYRYWPVGFKKSIASWTQNPKFRSLYSDSMVKMLGYKTVVSLLQRWADGELKELSVSACISCKKKHILRHLKKLGCTSKGSTFKLANRHNLELSFSDDFSRMYLDISD
ncbi:hypothetical protein QR680_016423 [Steinernema hermaphroditum]|uniref:Uncharacterized protein n=1 Tax=Steinernema hermaphroditum TaxID=289476 RepID=A0AA39HCA6_9BILA|nr:hypothetical protein QR680_016423 [Steinernema hermaphroditum]